MEPLESEGKWGTGPPAENGAVSSVSIVPKSWNSGFQSKAPGEQSHLSQTQTATLCVILNFTSGDITC